MWWNDRPRFARDAVPGFDHPHNMDGTHPGEEELDEFPGPADAPSWSSVDPGLFFVIRDRMQQEWADILGVKVSRLPVDSGDFTRVLREYGDAFKLKNGQFPVDLLTVRDDDDFWLRLGRRTNNADLLPARFKVETPQGTVVWENNIRNLVPQPIGLFEDVLQEELQALGKGQVSPDAIARLAKRRRADPTFGSMADLTEFLKPQPTRGGGGGGRGSLRFDRDQLAEGIRDRWRTLLREEPAGLGGLVSEFENAANAEWRAGGAQKNFDTWVINRIRQDPKYRLLYGRKDESQSELEYLGGFLTAEQFGLDPRISNREVIRGLESGAAPAAFAESVAFSRDVQALGQGSFSRRFAQLISQMGVLQQA